MNSQIIILVVLVESDKTAFSLSILDDLHESGAIPSIVIGGAWKESMRCKGFIVLASNYSSARVLVERLPRYSQHRIIVIISGSPAMAYKDALKDGPELYRDADVALLATGDLSSGYIMAQPMRYFTRFIQAANWFHSEKGKDDFYGREIHVVTRNCTLFSRIGPLDKNGHSSWHMGVELEIFTEIAKRLNLKPKYKIGYKNDSMWIKRPLTESGTNAADVAFCGILMSSRVLRMSVSMSVPIELLCLKNLVPRPVPRNTEWDTIFNPFKPELWFAIGIALLTTTFVLHRFSRCCKKFSNYKGIQKYEGLGDSFIQLFSILVISNVPKSSRGQGAVRHLLTWWAMYSMILGSCFSSGLISHLTKEEFTKKPNTIEELVKEKFRWAMKRTPDFNELLYLENFWQARWKHRFMKVKSKQDHLRLLAQGKQVLWGYYAHGGFALPEIDLPDSVLEKYEVVNKCFMEYFIGFAFRKGSPFENSINRYLQYYIEAGLVKASFQEVHDKRFGLWKYVYQVLIKTKAEFGGPKSLKMENLVGIFFLWITGTALSVFIFLLEIAQKFKI